MGGLAIWSNGKIPGAQTELASAEMAPCAFANGPCDPSKALTTDQIAACNSGSPMPRMTFQSTAICVLPASSGPPLARPWP